jgi:hypothetical protein
MAEKTKKARPVDASRDKSGRPLVLQDLVEQHECESGENDAVHK